MAYLGIVVIFSIVSISACGGTKAKAPNRNPIDPASEAKVTRPPASDNSTSAQTPLKLVSDLLCETMNYQVNDSQIPLSYGSSVRLEVSKDSASIQFNGAYKASADCSGDEVLGEKLISQTFVSKKVSDGEIYELSNTQNYSEKIRILAVAKEKGEAYSQFMRMEWDAEDSWFDGQWRTVSGGSPNLEKIFIVKKESRYLSCSDAECSEELGELSPSLK